MPAATACARASISSPDTARGANLLPSALGRQETARQFGRISSSSRRWRVRPSENGADRRWLPLPGLLHSCPRLSGRVIAPRLPPARARRRCGRRGRPEVRVGTGASQRLREVHGDLVRCATWRRCDVALKCRDWDQAPTPVGRDRCHCGEQRGGRGSPSSSRRLGPFPGVRERLTQSAGSEAPADGAHGNAEASLRPLRRTRTATLMRLASDDASASPRQSRLIARDERAGRGGSVAVSGRYRVRVRG
jgi:hypothetical protein